MEIIYKFTIYIIGSFYDFLQMKHGVCAALMDGVNDIVEPEGSGFDVTKSRFESENQHYSVLVAFIIRLSLKL